MKRNLEDVLFGLIMSAQDYAVLAIEYKQKGYSGLYLQCTELYEKTTALALDILHHEPLGERQ